jgi:hypothetical protein
MKYLIAIAIAYLAYKYFQHRNRITQNSEAQERDQDGFTDYEEID